MGFESISEFNAPPVIQTLVSQGQTSSPLFGFKLAESDSELSIGGLDSSVYSGTTAYTTVAQRGFWLIIADSLTVTGSSIVGSTSAIVYSVCMLQPFIY